MFECIGRSDHEDTETIKIDGHEVEYKTGISCGSAEEGRHLSSSVLAFGIALVPFLILGRHVLEYLDFAHPNALITLIIIASFFILIYCILSFLPFFVSYCRIFLEKLRWVCYSILIIGVIVGLWHMNI